MRAVFTEWLPKIKEIEEEMARTQKNKVGTNATPSNPTYDLIPW